MIRFGDILPEGSEHFTAPVEVLHSRGPLLASTKGQSGVQEMQQLQAAAQEVGFNHHCAKNVPEPLQEQLPYWSCLTLEGPGL